MGNPYFQQLFLSIYLILYGLSSLPLAYAALGDSSPTLDVTLVSVTFTGNQTSGTPVTDSTFSGYHSNQGQLLDKSLAPSKSGTSGYLFEFILDCSNTTNVTLIPNDPTSAPRVALITNSSCYLDGLSKVKNLDNVNGALIPNSLPQVTDTYLFPVFVISAEDGAYLGNQIIKYGSGSDNTTDRLKITMTSPSTFFPGVWEFTLIVVVVLLAVSFATSVAMHCHLYRIRRRQQRQRLTQRGTTGQLGTKIVTLNTEMLAKFPIRTYKGSSIATPLGASNEQVDNETKDSSSGKQEISSEDNHSSSEKQETSSEDNKYVPIDMEANASTVDLPSNPTSADDKNLNLRRNTSLNSIHSKKSVHSRKGGIHSRQVSIRSVRSTKSTRSENAIASATALAAGVSDNNTIEDQSYYNNTCAVCLEDFDEGDQLRTLICGHEYHTECIDPWLTQKSSLCPLCKHDCAPKTEHQENPEAPPDERSIYMDALLTWWPVVRGRNALQRIRRRSNNNVEEIQLENNNNNDNTNGSSTPLENTLTSVEVQQPNPSTSTLSRMQTDNSNHSMSQSSVSTSSNTQNEIILREIGIAGHIS